MYIDGLTKKGPYRISRNPQILSGYLLIIGTSLQRPSLYSLGWVLMYALITHWMIATEEEHLARIYGEEYEKYCLEVPRYLFSSKKKKVNYA
jgi:protein-S-isoprenylcysteine O-methyltransferase Ste14